MTAPLSPAPFSPGRDFSTVANEMLEEAVKLRRVPGISFADEPTGRVARVAGTGIEVWEIVQVYRDENEDWDRLREGVQWLTEIQLRAALAYAEAYPDEIDERLRREDRLTIETIWDWQPRPRAGRRSRRASGRSIRLHR